MIFVFNTGPSLQCVFWISALSPSPNRNQQLCLFSPTRELTRDQIVTKNRVFTLVRRHFYFQYHQNYLSYQCDYDKVLRFHLMVSLYYYKSWKIKIDWLTCLFQIENLSACKLSTHVPKFAFLAAEFLLTCCLVSTLHNRLLSAGSKVCSTQCCWLVLDMQYILRLCSHHVCIDHVCIHFACTYHQWIHHECLHHV